MSVRPAFLARIRSDRCPYCTVSPIWRNEREWLEHIAACAKIHAGEETEKSIARQRARRGDETP